MGAFSRISFVFVEDYTVPNTTIIMWGSINYWKCTRYMKNEIL